MIEYAFILNSGETYRFKVDLDRPPAHAKTAAKHAFWTALEFKKCTNCPLSGQNHSFCPAALDIEDIAQQFSDIKSFEQAKVEVRTAERTYVKYCDVQTGLRALLGLVMATCACPVTSRLKALAYFHLPFANVEDTLFRVVAAYLVKQYFVHQAGGQPDLELTGLTQFYQDLQEVNLCFKGRLDAASEKDANLNAICSLNFLSVIVSSSLEDDLQRLKPRFG